jgi:hypothetical protein
MIIDLIRLEVWAVLATAAVTVLYKMLNGRINMARLFGGGNSLIAAPRVQMLAITLFVAFDYIQRVVTSHDLGSLPDEPQDMLLLLGGSQTLYLGGKGAERLGWLSFLAPRQD